MSAVKPNAVNYRQSFTPFIPYNIVSFPMGHLTALIVYTSFASFSSVGFSLSVSLFFGVYKKNQHQARFTTSLDVEQLANKELDCGMKLSKSAFDFMNDTGC